MPTTTHDGLKGSGWWLDAIPEGLREGAVESIEAGDVLGFLITAASSHSVSLVYWNRRRLQARGLFEDALLEAVTATNTNNSGWPLWELQGLCEHADRDRLRAAGAALPGPGPFVLYRGVSGNGSARRVRGLSWTGSKETAAWFACRFAHLADPAVYQVTVPAEAVLAYVTDRQEEEYLVLVPARCRPRRLPLSLQALQALAAAEVETMRERNAALSAALKGGA